MAIKRPTTKLEEDDDQSHFGVHKGEAQSAPHPDNALMLARAGLGPMRDANARDKAVRRKSSSSSRG
ncbi:MAG: hypothetical protein JOZ70_02495 [Pseudolabrys sp.]|nr:hypothetical protein [Pseudolabrys sp.]MBV9954096.1 hypothetical protein [Pseudolabrys sp.]